MSAFIPSVTLSGLPPAYQMMAPGVRAQPGQTEKVQLALLERVLQVGSDTQFDAWGANKYSQLDHYRGVVSLAIKPYLNATRAAKFNVLQCVSNPRDGRIGKALPVGHFSRDEEYEPLDEDHPLARIVAQPNGEDGKWSLAREAAFLTLQYLLTGDAPAWTPYSEQDKPVQFYALAAASVQLQFGPGVNPQWPKGAYRITPYGGMGSIGIGGGLYAGAVLPAEEVVRLTDEDQYLRGAGRSRLQVGSREIDILDAIIRSRYSYFDRGTQLDFAVSIPGLVGDEVKALQESIRDRHGGADKHGNRILILGGGLPDGKTSIQTVGQTSQEMGFLESFEQAAAMVGALFGTPKPMMGLTDSSTYSTLYASKQQFYELGLIPYFLRMSDFLTTALAMPWSEYHGQYKIEVEPPPLGDKEMEEKEREFAVQNGLITVNEYRKATGRKPLPDADVPPSIYTAKLQQAIAPQPQPGQDAIPGEEQPADGMPTEGAAGQPGADASPEAAQDGITQAALEALGVGGAEEQPQPGTEEIQKAQRQARTEGQKWQAGGKWYTKKNGKIHEIGDPSKQQRPQAQPAGKPAAGSPARVGEGAGAIVSNMYDAVQQSIEKTGDVPSAERRAGSTFAQVWDKVKAAGLHTHPESAKRFTTAMREAATDHRSRKDNKLNADAVRDALNKHFTGMSPVGKPGVAPQQQQPTTAAPKPTPQEDAASQEAWKRVPDANKAAATKKAQAFAQSPEGKAILAKADVWAHQQAAKHADKVAAKLKCSPQLAQHILANAIKMLCRQALESPEGSAETSLTLNQPGGTKVKLGIARKQGPTSGAVPKPTNAAAKGTGVPRVGKAMGRSQRVRELVARVLEPLNQE